jgi:uroporphyrinogen III methyltransferase/synthase
MSRSRPLVISTRPDGAEDAVVAQLTAAGIDVAAVPTVALEDADPGGPLDRAVASADRWDWVVVTSRRGVEALAAATRRGGARPLAEWRARWAAVGDGTAGALARYGVTGAVVPADQHGSAIAAALADRADLHGLHVLLPRAGAADGSLPEQLGALGALVHEVVAYRTVIGPATSLASLGAALTDARLVLALVASGSAVHGLVELAESAGPDATARLRTLPMVSIGPSTSATVERLGLVLAGEARRPTVTGIVEAVVAALDGVATVDLQAMAAT